MTSSPHVTRLLLAWGQGDDTALDQLIPIVHAELHRIAKACMTGERPGHSLQATAPVNEGLPASSIGRATTRISR